MSEFFSKTPKLFSLPVPLLIAMGFSCFIFGAIIGTITTYLLLYLKPSEQELSFANGESREIIATVTRVIDGDTIAVDISGQEKIVRYLGIDAPENKGDERVYYGKESLKKNETLVGGKQIKLVCEGKFQGISRRLLAYVYVGDVFVNAEMLKGGYASIYRRNPSRQLAKHRHYGYFYELQQQARSLQAGIWDIEQKRKWERQYDIIPSLNPLKYIAGNTGRYFHRPDCPKVEHIKFRLYYYDRQDAICNHKFPCPICKP